MTHLTRGRRVAAFGAAGALVAAGLAFAPAAQAAAPGPVLTWGISQYLNEHLTEQAFTGGATEDEAGVVTFVEGVGTSDAETGVTEMTYTGTASYGFTIGGPAFYGVTITDPTVAIDAEGEGSIAADVAWFGSAVTAGAVEDVVLTTFDAPESAWDGAAVTATPDWLGVAALDAYGAGKPVAGGSWAQDFVLTLPASTRATFYASGSASDSKKVPSQFTAQVPAAVVVADPAVTSSIVDARPSSGVDLKVTGTGFSATAGNPGDDGVYVGVAPEGAEIDYDDRVNGTAAMIGVDWVAGSQIVDGSFTRVLNLPSAKLTKGTSYVLHTWRAHTHSETSQDTITPVSIPWAKLAKAKATTKVAVTKPTTKKAGTLAVTFGGTYGTPTGQAKVTIKKGAKKVGAVRTAKLTKAGKISVKLPKAAKGTYTVIVKLVATADYRATTAKRQYKVTK